MSTITSTPQNAIPKLDVSPQQYEALKIACDAFVPSLQEQTQDAEFWAIAASDFKVADRVLEMIAIQTQGEQKEFLQLLDLLSSKLLGATWLGPFKNISQLSAEQKEKMFLKWSKSRLGPLRKAFNSLRKLSTFLVYSYIDEKGQNPTWKYYNYPGPLNPPPSQPDPIKPLTLTKATTLTCDVVIVGSGAGGGLAAGMFAEAGKEVILLEKGAYISESRMTQLEGEMIAKTYEKQGAIASVDGGVSVFAGSCLGGGTTVNWAGSFYTPPHILQEWSSKHDLPHLLTKSYQESSDAVMQAGNVNTDESYHNAQNQALWDGSQKLGQKVKVIPRNVNGCSKHNCKHCGYCGLGCQDAHKQGTLTTWIQRAYDKGAKILVNTTANKVHIQANVATGIEATYQAADGQQHQVYIKAKKVIIAASALHTPALLMRSGIKHTHLGRHLYFHPTVAVSAKYDHAMEPWLGTMMSSLNDGFSSLDGNYGFKLETPPTHPGMIALALPWTSGKQHKENMLQIDKLGSFIVLTRDKNGGRITVDKQGEAIVNYQLSLYDRMHMLRGLEEATRIHLAAGAKEILFPHFNFKTLLADSSQKQQKDFFEDMKYWSWKAGKFALFCAHQMGTCRMGGNAKKHPLTPEGQVRGIANLYVADGSAFPESSGVNPMISIMTMTHYTVKGIIAGM